VTSPGVLIPPIEEIEEAHGRLIALYGGAPGLRDRDGLEAAIARADQLRAYAEAEPDVFELAAAIACSITRIRHPFVDGNKRAGFYAAFITLYLNGHYLDVSEQEAAATFLAVAGGMLAEEALVRWLKDNATALE
jgi:death on curing protein